MGKKECVIVNGKRYVPEDEMMVKDDMKYVLVRTYSAGVFAGWLESRNGQEVVLRQARRIWYWDGAATLSQLAREGTRKPGNCKFPAPVDSILLLQAIEIIDCTKEAFESIKGVAEWRQ